MSTTPQAMQPTATKALIRVAGLRKSFRMGDSIVEVLRNVDLTVREGEFLAIEGRSGSGKSTLMHLLGALDVVDGGTIDYEGTEFGSMSAAERSRLRNRHFGFVFQFYHLLPELSVLENTLLAPMIELSWGQFRAQRAELQARAAGVLEQLGLGHRLKHRPATLSGGERQRVAIARALMNTPRVLFADEPTGNLDTETGRQIMDVLEKLHREKGQTILMVTHDRSLAVEADRVLLLQNGRLVNERK
ncbi:MAG TPA: ABC transporter ATP-binding protein [Tepidisphaeraceae bacterium]|nr:ABC transporter ATP-binding protein [Tepidisphaeraceae bacterium]